MSQPRDVLTRAGFDEVRPFFQSGNVVLASHESPERVAEQVNRLIKKTFAIDVPVLVRSQLELGSSVLAATCRNWTTVSTLLAMADDSTPR